MKHIFIFGFCLVAINAMPVANNDEDQFNMLPISKERRDQLISMARANSKGFGISHKGTIIQSNGNRVDASAYVNKYFHSHGLEPDQFGGRVDYKHEPSKTSAFIGADHTRHLGTDVSAGIKHDIYSTKNLNVGVGVDYGRHFGGPGGNSKPEIGGVIQATGTF